MSHPYLRGLDQELFPVDPNQNYEQIEQYLSTVTSFWAAGKLEELVEYVKKLIDMQIYDIRLLSFYFYSLWAIETFDCSLDQVLQAFQNLIKQPDTVWFLKEEGEENKDTDALSETARKQLKASVNLFLTRVLQKLERFAGQLENEEPFPCEIMESAEQFSEMMEQMFQLSEMSPLVQQISSHFRDACRQKMELVEQETMLAAEEVTVEADDNEMVEQADDSSRELEEAADINEVQVQERQIATQYALPMQQLLNKVYIFETLMANSDIYKAAIVFESIQKELQAFNPLHYLPELFSDYAKTHALYAAELYQLLHTHDGVQSQALKDYFAIDPEGFLQLEIDGRIEHDDSYTYER